MYLAGTLPFMSNWPYELDVSYKFFTWQGIRTLPSPHVLSFYDQNPPKTFHTVLVLPQSIPRPSHPSKPARTLVWIVGRRQGFHSEFRLSENHANYLTELAVR